MKILVVEDDAVLGIALCLDVSDFGHVSIGPVRNIDQAIAQAREHRPKLALVDVDLGAGGNGVDLAWVLHSELDCRSIFISGSAAEARLGKFAIGLLHKPYTRSALHETIDLAALVLAGLPSLNIPRGFELFDR